METIARDYVALPRQSGEAARHGAETVRPLWHAPRHHALAGVGRWWLRIQFAGDGDFDEALAVWRREYARHLGHADLFRERIDGATGW